MDSNPPGPSVHGILQARILEWTAFSFSRGSSPPRDRTCASCLAGRFFTPGPPGNSLPFGQTLGDPNSLLTLELTLWASGPQSWRIIEIIASFLIQCMDQGKGTRGGKERGSVFLLLALF